MKNTLAFFFSIALVMSLTACSSTSTSQDLGIIGGAAVGGLAGNALTGGSTAGTIVGAAGGAYVGSQLAN